MILLVLVGLLWVAVLAPSAWRRFSERQGVGSIDHFHHQLRLLEHAAPKTVTPAYRLHTAVPGRTGTEAQAGGGLFSTQVGPLAADRRRGGGGRRRRRGRPLRTGRCPRPARARMPPRGQRRPVGVPACTGAPPLHDSAALPVRCGPLDGSDRVVPRHASRVDLHCVERLGRVALVGLMAYARR